MEVSRRCWPARRCRGRDMATALTWALEVGDPHRLLLHLRGSGAICGLTAALRSSAGKQQRGPLSKQRNAWLQSVLIEAAKLAPRWNPQLAQLHAQQMERGTRQSRHLAGGAQASGLFAGRRQEWAAFSAAHAAAKNNSNEEKKPRDLSSRRLSQSFISGSFCQRSTSRSSRFRGLCTGAQPPNTPYRLF